MPGSYTVESRVAPSRDERRPPGTVRSKPQTPRAGRLGFGGLAALKGLRQASMSRGVEARGSIGTLASRAPSVLFGAGG